MHLLYVEPPLGTRSLLKGNSCAAQPGVLPGPFNLPGYVNFPGTSRINRWFLERMLLPEIPQGTKRIAITCASFWEPLLSRSFFDMICYDCLDALAVHAAQGNYTDVAAKHAALLAKSDLLFVTAASLHEEVLRDAPGKKVVTICNGVDYDFFEQRRYAEIAFPSAAGKVVGYVGAIRDWIDLQLVAAVADCMPEVTFVMVGPVDDACLPLMQGCPENMLFVGEQPYSDVPAWIDRFDVALIPFKQSAIAEATNPIKLYEYFSLGKPVVATSMRELSRYRDDGLLYVADNARDFSAAIRAALKSCRNDAERRQEIARRNSWQSKAELMASSIEAGLKLHS